MDTCDGPLSDFNNVFKLTYSYKYIDTLPSYDFLDGSIIVYISNCVKNIRI